MTMLVDCFTEEKKLDKDLRNFVEDRASKGTIYIAFGSIVHWDSGPHQVEFEYNE